MISDTDIDSMMCSVSLAVISQLYLASCEILCLGKQRPGAGLQYH